MNGDSLNNCNNYRLHSFSSKSVFDRSGLAALSDFNTLEWKSIFSQLENDQVAFLKNEAVFRSKALSCSHDPLHQWSRVWEYPYVYHHVKKLKMSLPEHNKLQNIVDFGSGVSFFPFSIAKLGFHVNCIDIDPVCEKDMNRAKQLTECLPGKVDFLLATGLKIPLEDQSVDGIYCISVLEHIEQFEKTVKEMARILIPGGLLVLTFDLAASGLAEIKADRFKCLQNVLFTYFDFKEQETTIHPVDLLHSSTGPYPIHSLLGNRLRWYKFKQRLKPIVGKKPFPVLRLYVYGGVFTRKKN